MNSNKPIRTLFFILTLCVHGFLLFNSNHTPSSRINFSEKFNDISQIKVALKLLEKKEVTQAKKTPRKKVRKAPKKKVKKSVAKKDLAQEKTLKKIVKRESGSLQEEALYLKRVRDEILRHKKYPRIARKLRKSGIVSISFDIEYPGKVNNLKVVKKLDFEPLNKSALESVKSIEKFPVMPDSLSSKKLKVSLPISFEIL